MSSTPNGSKPEVEADTTATTALTEDQLGNVTGGFVGSVIKAQLQRVGTMDGVKGESTTGTHQDKISIESF